MFCAATLFLRSRCIQQRWCVCQRHGWWAVVGRNRGVYSCLGLYSLESGLDHRVSIPVWHIPWPKLTSNCLQHMDQIHSYRDCRINGGVVHFLAGCCVHWSCHLQWRIPRIQWNCSHALGQRQLLAIHHFNTIDLQPARLLVEIVSITGYYLSQEAATELTDCLQQYQTHVQTAAISLCARDPKIQPTRLPPENGQIPSSCQQSPEDSASQTKPRLRVFTERQRSKQDHSSVRYDYPEASRINRQLLLILI